MRFRSCCSLCCGFTPNPPPKPPSHTAVEILILPPSCFLSGLQSIDTTKTTTTGAQQLEDEFKIALIHKIVRICFRMGINDCEFTYFGCCKKYSKNFLC